MTRRRAAGHAPAALILAPQSPMRARRAGLVLAVGASLVLVVGWRGVGGPRAVESGMERAAAGAVARTRQETGRRRDVQIAAWTRAVATDSASAVARGMVAALYLQRGRESGDFNDYVRAEAEARRSIATRTNRNLKTYSTLASSLMAQHRFAEARSVAERMVALDGETATYRATLGETQLEVGDYTAARATFTGLLSKRNDVSVAARIARWAELTGSLGYARRLAASARDSAVRRADLPPEQVAWFNMRVGDLELKAGHVERAQEAYTAGLAANPGDYRLLAAIARLAAARHRWDDAIAFGEQTLSVTVDPATLGVLADAYAARGDSAKAAEYLRVLDVAFVNRPGPYHRGLGLFLVDAGQHLAEVESKVRDELATRRDVYGYDLLAWTLHAQGRDREAEPLMGIALGQRTEDALLFYHAGMIDRSLGHATLARRELERALELNPYFHPTQPALARAAIDSLRRVDSACGWFRCD